MKACPGDGSGRPSRSALARELCERESWRGPSGRLCCASARKLLPKLAASLGVPLPAPEARLEGAHRRAETGYPDRALACGLSALGEVSLDPVPDGERRSWESMVESHHPKGCSRAPGGRVLYWIRSSRHGVLGGAAFAAANCQLKPRDDFIGWSADARLANIGLAVCNSRFLILPSVKVRGLASLALRLGAERVAGDWEAKYGARPALAYSFTGPGQSGLSYRAAGWSRCAEKTSGRRSGERLSVWTKPLEEGWRERLCTEPRRVLGQAPAPWLEGDWEWEDREYARGCHTDGRVRARIAAMGKAWLERPGEDLPIIFPGKAQQRAAYRLLSNGGVTMEHILESHYQASAERCGSEKLVLAVQDTTTVNYDGLEATAGLDDLGGGGKGTDGILAHCSVAINGAGRPLGLIGIDASFRQSEDKDSIRWVRGLDRANELSAACPGTKVVTVCDREGDFWELLARAKETGAALLVRASKSSKRRVELPGGERTCLWEHMREAKSRGARTVKVPERGGPFRRKARTARLTVRCEAVELVPPVAVGGETIRMVAVSAREERPPTTVEAKKEALHWLLLTTEGEPGAGTAATALRWYELRWRIERYFDALKNGTRIKDRRLDHADDLKKCLAFDAITAFRVWDLALLARERPDDPARLHVAWDDIDMVCLLAEDRGFKVPRGPPDMDIRTFVVLAAGLAGFHTSKRQPLPGTQKLWKGLKILWNGVNVAQVLRKRKMKMKKKKRKRKGNMNESSMLY